MVTGGRVCLSRQGKSIDGARRLGGGAGGNCVFRRPLTPFAPRKANRIPLPTPQRLRMRYFKMNGAGNDFVIFDARAHGALALSPAQARAIADRDTGVGCDQVIAIERSIRGDAFM